MQENKPIKIDLTLTIIDTLLSNRKIYPDIDKLYEENKYEAYKLAKETHYYTCQYIKTRTIERLVYSRKILGLLCIDGMNEDLQSDNVQQSIIMQLINKGWKNIYYEVKNSSKPINVREITLKYSAKSNPTSEEFNAMITVMSLTAKYYNKEIEKEDIYRIYIETIINLNKFHLDKGCKYKFDYSKVEDNDKRIAKKLKNRIFDKYGRLKNYDDITNITVRDSKNNDKLDEIDKKMLYYKNIILEKYIVFDDIEMIEIKEKDIEELCYLYYSIYKNFNVDKAFVYVIEGLYINALGNDLVNTKEYYTNNNKETMYIDLEGYRKECEILKDNNDTLTRDNTRLKNEIDRLKSDYKDSIERENIELKNKIKELESRLLDTEAKHKDKLKELYELREVVFDSGNSDNDSSLVNDMGIKNVKLPPASIVIVGGNINWQIKIKEWLVKNGLNKNYIVLDGKNDSFDLGLLKNKDLVIFNVSGMCHSMYYKIRNECRIRGIEYRFLVNKVNIEWSLKEIDGIVRELEL